MGIAPSRHHKADTVTLQHWADGSVGVLCHSCNTSDGMKGRPLQGSAKWLKEGVMLSVDDQP